MTRCRDIRIANTTRVQGHLEGPNRTQIPQTRVQTSQGGESSSTSSSSSEDSDESTEQIAKIALDKPRRSLQVTFTCDKCGGRTERMVNPIAWDKGLVFVQCGQCEAWHKIKDAAGLIEEYRFIDDPEGSGERIEVQSDSDS
ncbi:hypothetical protein WJX72_009887 [[Myrmecia] bisecta]|uniref:DNL-type domain-containing protein n=1 Tax=[Myrmecia] bisecta TaxID=41462 RepID=A0AAW1QG61_9CHLO